MDRGTIRVAIIAIVAVTLWRMVASKIPVIGRWAA